MNKTHLKKLFLLVLLTLGLQAWSDVVIIVHPESPLQSISVRDVRDLFLGTRSRIGGVSLAPVLIREGTTHDAFLSSHVGRTAVQFQTHWRTIVFTGRGKPLTTFDHDEEVVKFVSENSQAIGYVATASVGDTVRILPVE